MIKYNLLGKTVTFSDANERFFSIIKMMSDAKRNAVDRFNQWYNRCGNIQTVLENYTNVSNSIIDELAVKPLFAELVSCDIYDVSETTYRNKCVDLSATVHAFRDINNRLQGIERREDSEAAYREARKAARGRWVGGGFGLGGAIKGAATAGALNAITGLGHSVVNAVGNAGSAASASADKNNLYREPHTPSLLLSGVLDDLESVFFSHMDLLNKHFPNYVVSSFDLDKANALFENAKKIPEKQQELLVQSFEKYPWNQELLEYIFLNYLSERKAVGVAAERFQVDLAKVWEELLAPEYTEVALQSEEAAQMARKRIVALMEENGIPQSATLDRLESDCLKRLCNDYEKFSESECDILIGKIRAYDALEKNKQPYLKMVQGRIEEIWSAEDGEIFDNLYLKTDLTNQNEVIAALEYVKDKGRTASSEKYTVALNACNPTNLKLAQAYAKGRRPLLLGTLTWAFFLAAIINTFWLHAGFLRGAVCVVVAVILFSNWNNLKENWNVLTIDGSLLHPAFAKEYATASTAVKVVLVIGFTAVIVFAVGLTNGKSTVSKMLQGAAGPQLPVTNISGPVLDSAPQQSIAAAQSPSDDLLDVMFASYIPDYIGVLGSDKTFTWIGADELIAQVDIQATNPAAFTISGYIEIDLYRRPDDQWVCSGFENNLLQIFYNYAGEYTDDQGMYGFSIDGNIEVDSSGIMVDITPLNFYNLEIGGSDPTLPTVTCFLSYGGSPYVLADAGQTVEIILDENFIPISFAIEY